MLSAMTSRRTSLPRPGDRLDLGAGLRVSPFCVGMTGSPETVCAAYDAGINFFFLSADMHWPLYEGMRRGLETLLGRGVRDRIAVGVVSYATQPEFCWMPFREAVEAVPGLERIDVTIAGGVYGPEFATRAQVYREHRRQAYLGARAIGASFHDRPAAADATARGLVDISFVRYNPAHPGARADVFPHLPEPRSTLLYTFKSTDGYVPPSRCAQLGLDGAYWRPRVTDHYRFALTSPRVDGILCSLDGPAEVAEFAAAMEAGPLDEEEERYLIELAMLDRGKAGLRLDGGPGRPL
ncbi:MAG: hypothetical protein HYY17_12560 [Planctomycetes bacterium]|nr:hypothetical protein [Planctomycetota bacterium]